MAQGEFTKRENQHVRGILESEKFRARDQKDERYTRGNALRNKKKGREMRAGTNTGHSSLGVRDTGFKRNIVKVATMLNFERLVGLGAML